MKAGKKRLVRSRRRLAYLRDLRAWRRVEATHKRLSRVHDELAVAYLQLTDPQRQRAEALLKTRGVLAHGSIARELGLTHSFVHSLARQRPWEASAQ